MGVRIGVLTFSSTDARRTVAEAVDLIDECAGDDPARVAALALRRARVERLVTPGDAWNDPIEVVEQRLRAVWDEVSHARDDLASSGLLPAPEVGTVVGLHRSGGGVPKQPVPAVHVLHDGVVGDRQGTRRHHGAPWQALCLWSEEVIAAFAAGGHPIAPGAAGENVTVSGLDWGEVRPGVRLAIGDVLCEVSSFAVPCRQNAPWFSDRDFDRIHHRHGPVSRVYATVLRPGAVRVGDAAVLEP